MIRDAADVVVVGGGVAGRAAAWFAARAGRDVTLVDDGRDRASDLPLALVNPLRGRDGRLVARGVDGMRATFALVDALRAEGHPIAAGRGLMRPLVDVAAEAATEGWWRERLAGRLAFAFVPATGGDGTLPGGVPSLLIDEAGWLAPAGLLAALASARRTTTVAGRVVAVAPDRVRLAGGTTIVARRVVWCAGARGAAGLDDDVDERADRSADDAVGAANDGLYRPGSLAICDERLTDRALAFGLYAAPAADGGTIVGPTREPGRATFEIDGHRPDAVHRLQDRVAALFGVSIALRAAWRGVRLMRLSTNAAARLAGVDRITALGSRGFLVGPLLAAEWAASL